MLKLITDKNINLKQKNIKNRDKIKKIVGDFIEINLLYRG